MLLDLEGDKRGRDYWSRINLIIEKVKARSTSLKRGQKWFIKYESGKRRSKLYLAALWKRKTNNKAFPPQILVLTFLNQMN